MVTPAGTVIARGAHDALRGLTLRAATPVFWYMSTALLTAVFMKESPAIWIDTNAHSSSVSNSNSTKTTSLENLLSYDGALWLESSLPRPVHSRGGASTNLGTAGTGPSRRSHRPTFCAHVGTDFLADSSHMIPLQWLADGRVPLLLANLLLCGALV